MISSPTPSITGLLTPYHTITPNPVIPTSTIIITVPVTPAPSPTPYLYTVKKDDSMLGIAYLFGISLQDLQAANPTVNPHIMSIGTKLVIPIEGEIPVIEATPAPIPLKLEPPNCYPSGDGGATCVVAINNTLQISLENLVVWIGLFSTQGELITSQEAYPFLNILRPGKLMPAMAYFPPPLPDGYTARGELMNGLEVLPEDNRYLDLQLVSDPANISADGRQVSVSGEVLVPSGTNVPSELWVLGVAYNSEGKVIGARKWKSSGETHFDFTVFSLDGKIDHAELLLEARP